MKPLDVKLMHPHEQIAVIIGQIYRHGMTTTSGGNISIRDENGDIWITPSAMDKGNLTPTDIMCVKKDGTTIGSHKPSSELPFHKAIYAIRPELKAIIHAHPAALVAFSIARKAPDTKITAHTYSVCGEVGFAPYGCPGSEELGQKIANEFKNPRYNAVIMENHGVVLGGIDMMDAYRRFETLEWCCQTIINAKQLGEVNYLSDEDTQRYIHHLPSDFGKRVEIDYPSDERLLRKEIIRILRRAYKHQLMSSSYGAVSTRWRNNDFLITPRDVPCWCTEPQDIVQVKNGTVESEKTPDYSVKLHQRIYELNPHIHSIISAQPTHLLAHAISGTKLDVRTIPESWIFLQDVPSVPFDLMHDKIDDVAAIFAHNRMALFENDAVIVTGDKLLNTFDYLEVAEFSAKSLVMATSIGNLQPMGDAEIEELKVAFNIQR